MMKFKLLFILLFISYQSYSQEFASFFNILQSVKEMPYNIQKTESGIVIKTFNKEEEVHYIFRPAEDVICDSVKVFPYTFIDDLKLQDEYNKKYRLIAPYLWAYSTKFITATIQRIEGDRIYYLYTLKF